MDIKRY